MEVGKKNDQGTKQLMRSDWKDAKLEHISASLYKLICLLGCCDTIHDYSAANPDLSKVHFRIQT